MQIEVQTKIGKSLYKFLVDEEDDKKALLKAAVFGSPPSYCHECGNSEFFELEGRIAQQKYTYISIKCKKCGAQANLSTYQGNAGYFWKQFEKYAKGEESSSADMAVEDQITQ